MMDMNMSKDIVENVGSRFADSQLGKMSEGKVFSKPMSEYDKPLGLIVDGTEKTKEDDNGNTYTDENGDLLPNTEYVLNGNIYRTDENGRIISCESIPKAEKAPRNTVDQDRVGGEDRKRPGDEGGHIVASEVNGHGDIGNLIPLDMRINRSDYRRMEKQIADATKEGKDVKTDTKIIYNGDSKRPDKIITTVTIDGKDTVYTFDNNLDGSLIDNLKETCSESDIETIKDVLDETDGQISAIKEEYDAEGNLEKTTATVTYIGEDGKNYRRQIVIDNKGGVSQ